LIFLWILGLAIALGFHLVGLGANATDFQLQLSPGMLVQGVLGLIPQPA
jgi:hypothetical protein